MSGEQGPQQPRPPRAGGGRGEGRAGRTPQNRGSRRGLTRDSHSPLTQGPTPTVALIRPLEVRGRPRW